LETTLSLRLSMTGGCASSFQALKKLFRASPRWSENALDIVKSHVQSGVGMKLRGLGAHVVEQEFILDPPDAHDLDTAADGTVGLHFGPAGAEQHILPVEARSMGVGDVVPAGGQTRLGGQQGRQAVVHDGV
jgi:hypothetical protein